MAFEPYEITKEHVLKAINKIEINNIELIQPTKYYAIINGKKYPPKEIMRYAHEEMNGEHLWELSGGKPTNKYLIDMGFEIVEKINEDNMFDWIPIYKEIAEKLLQFRNNRKPLIELLNEMDKDGLKVINLNDKYDANSDITSILLDIDPFTFFANFNRAITVNNRIALIERIKSKWELKEALPTDFSGLPALTPQNAWFFGYTFQRGDNDIENLWDLFIEIMSTEPQKVKNILFDSSLSQRGIKQNITAGLFWVQPNRYFPLVGSVEVYLRDNFNITQIKIDKIKYKGYLEILDIIKEKTNDPFYLVSHNAYTYARNKEEIIKNESLIEEFLQSSHYLTFKNDILPLKIEREETAWDIIKKNKDKITSDVISKFIDKVDFHNGKAGWFGLMLVGNNKNKILNTSNEKINEWVSKLLFSELDSNIALEQCLKEFKLTGASYGFASLLLYISDPEENNVFIPNIAQSAFDLLTTINLKKSKAESEKYSVFNDTVKYIRDKYNLKPQEMDWFLNNISNYNKQIDPIGPIVNNGENMGLNTILYGPPGTGKTYETISRAVQIVENLSEDEFNKTYEGRREIKNKYQEYSNKGQIQFVTFHQSFAYEDFVEGIKPVIYDLATDDTSDLRYQIEDGIFKKICNAAMYPANPTFEHSYNKLLDDLNDKPEGLRLKIVGNDVVLLSHPNETDLKVDSPHFKRITKDGLEYVSSSQKFVGIWGQYYKAIFDLLSKHYGYDPTQIESRENYVLIIDEINRGNIASIFGELITLIEDDKRRGAKEELEAILPYSKKKLSVPQNLYIIGTMNTADRSVEALDTALRRRFEFEEIKPQPDLINPSSLVLGLWMRYEHLDNWNEEPFFSRALKLYEFLGFPDNDFKISEKYDKPLLDVTWNEIDWSKHIPLDHFNGFRPDLMLKKINNRIERLLDSDHSIGHSYFMIISDCDEPFKELKKIFKNKIIPLLQEYFYGDMAKIGLILGKDFVEYEKILSNDKLFADFDYENIEEYEEINIAKLKNIDDLEIISFKKIYE